MAELNIAEVLGKQLQRVSNSGTDGREQIEYIDIDRLDADAKNFYTLSELDALAANIELIGLQQPLRVRVNPDAPDRFTIVSGHRRRAALQQLVDDGQEKFRSVPCIRETADGSAAMQELRLIYANSDTRKMCGADIQQQAKRIEELLYQLKEQEGFEFPGRMRDHVAEICKVSKSKLARLKVIDDRLVPVWQHWYKKDALTEAAAYRLAQMPPKHQVMIFETRTEDNPARYLYEGVVNKYAARMETIDKITCGLADRSGAECSNRERMYKCACRRGEYASAPCRGCCDQCADLGTCKYACPLLKDKIKRLKEDSRAQRQQEALAREALERPQIEEIQRLWARFGEARRAAGKTVKDVYKAADLYYASSDGEKVANLESGSAKVSPNTTLPYGYSCYLGDIRKYVRVADALGVSLDYLLCRTDEPQGMGKAPAAPAEGWIPGDQAPARDRLEAVAKFRVPGMDQPLRRIALWEYGSWRFPNGSTIDAECICWYPLPDEEE